MIEVPKEAPKYLEGEHYFKVVISYIPSKNGWYRFIDEVFDKEITQEEMVQVISGRSVY